MFSKIGVFLDSLFKDIGSKWVKLYRDCGTLKESPLPLVFILLTWVTVCFAPVVLYWMHKFVFNVWLATFTSATPFSDYNELKLLRKTEAYARQYDAEQCVAEWRAKINK